MLFLSDTRETRLHSRSLTGRSTSETLIEAVRAFVQDARLDGKMLDANAIAQALHAVHPNVDPAETIDMVIQEAMRAGVNVSWE